MSRKRKPVRRVTLDDVARDANVSRSTASLVVRNSSLVADDTRKRVQASMKKLGYVYHRAAASMRTQQSQTVSLIITNVTNPFFAELTVGVEEILDGGGYALLLSNTGGQEERQERALDLMLEYQLSGVILCSATDAPGGAVERMLQWHVPFVMAVHYLRHVDADYVGVDNVLGAHLAVEHLLRMDHRRIAFIGGPPSSSSQRERLAGYESVLQENDVEVDPALVVPTDVSREGGHQAVQRLLDAPDPPTAAFCYNDLVAFGVMLGLRARGLLPGRDFAVVGFDDIREAELWTPSLTTVSVAPQLIGQEAARMLLRRIERPEAPISKLMLKPELVVRESCGEQPAGERVLA